MAEQLILDPGAVSTGRNQLEITQWVDAGEGIDYGDAEIQAFMSDMERGSVPVDFRVPNRQVTIPLVVKATGGTTFAQARQLLEHKAALLQREGGWFGRVLSSNTAPTGGTVYADVVNCSLKFGGSWLQTHKNVDPDAELRLELIPDWYGDERQLGDHVETTNTELIWTETNIAGDYPGRIRLVVDNDDATNPQRSLLWGVRARNYSNSTTARLTYSAPTELTALDQAFASGAWIVHQNVSTQWTPVLSTTLLGSGAAMTHTGTYRVWALAQTSTSIRLRWLWDVGDFLNPVANEPVTFGGTSGRIVDLGQVRLDRVPAGTHRWQGMLQAASDVGGGFVQVQRLWFQPVDEGSGVLRAPVNPEPGLSSFAARDEFNQTSGALNGKTLPVGGAWSGAGDTDDFVINATSHTLQRTAISDTSVTTGRFGVAGGSSFSTVVVQGDIQLAGIDRQMVIARYGSANTWVGAGFRQNSFVVVEGYSAGVGVVAFSAPMALNVDGWYTVRAYLDTSGNILVWVFPQGGSPGTAQIVGRDSNLATGGALASGRVGVYDAWTAATARTRSYDNFAAWVPTTDAVLFNGRSAELRTEGMFRQDSTGAAYGPVSYLTGDLPRIPPSGLENRTVQFFVKADRTDMDVLSGAGFADDISARVSYRPSWLHVPS
jgi:hypothetical protein